MMQVLKSSGLEGVAELWSGVEANGLKRAASEESSGEEVSSGEDPSSGPPPTKKSKGAGVYESCMPSTLLVTCTQLTFFSC